jgi:asparagine synthase (glutamine-hydrolysing)
MRHQVCRGSPNDFGRLLEILQDAHGAPLLTPSNLPWWDAVNRQAAADGATVLLTGQVGNYSISAGGPTLVRDLAREGRWGDFLRGAGRFAREHGARNATTRLLGPLLPASLYDGLRRTARGTVSENELPLIRGPWRRRAEELRRERLADHRPPASYRAFLRESLLQLDNAERMSAAVYGLDVRDPTADRRLVELVMTFPATALFGREDRPAFARAFADRLPSAVIASRNRAYQQSDWFERLDPADVLAGFRRLARHPLVDELIDAREVERMVEAWPLGTSWMADPRRFAAVEDDFRNKLLPTLAVATFVGANFPG